MPSHENNQTLNSDWNCDREGNSRLLDLKTNTRSIGLHWYIHSGKILVAKSGMWSTKNRFPFNADFPKFFWSEIKTLGFLKNPREEKERKAKFTENVVFPRHLSQWRIFQCFPFTVFKTIGIKNHWVVKFKFNQKLKKLGYSTTYLVTIWRHFYVNVNWDLF